MNINDHLRRPKGKTLEFKRDQSSPLPILKTLTAFANGAGGTLVIGVADKTRDVVGVQDALDQEEKLANWIADGIVPKLAADIEISAWRSIQLLVVHVFPSALRPHHLRKKGTQAGTYIRIGSTNRQADAPLIARQVLALPATFCLFHAVLLPSVFLRKTTEDSETRHGTLSQITTAFNVTLLRPLQVLESACALLSVHRVLSTSLSSLSWVIGLRVHTCEPNSEPYLRHLYHRRDEQPLCNRVFRARAHPQPAA
jgi:hypothetical protein